MIFMDICHQWLWLTQYFEFEREFFKFVVDMLGDYAKKKYADEMDAGWEA